MPKIKYSTYVNFGMSGYFYPYDKSENTVFVEIIPTLKEPFVIENDFLEGKFFHLKVRHYGKVATIRALAALNNVEALLIKVDHNV